MLGKKLALRTTKEYILHPGQQQQLQLQPEEQINTAEQIGIVEPIKKLDIALTSHPACYKHNRSSKKVRDGSTVATFEITTPEQARYLVLLESKLFQTENENKRSKQIAKLINGAARETINHIAITHENQRWFPTPKTHSSSTTSGSRNVFTTN